METPAAEERGCWLERIDGSQTQLESNASYQQQQQQQQLQR